MTEEQVKVIKQQPEMLHALLIHPNGLIEQVDVVNVLENICSVVGGYLEMVSIQNHLVRFAAKELGFGADFNPTMLVDEDGFSKLLMENHVANALHGVRLKGSLAGPALLVNRVRIEGNDAEDFGSLPHLFKPQTVTNMLGIMVKQLTLALMP